MYDFTAQPWFQNGHLQRVWQALYTPASEARAVGGCVRNTLLGAAVDEVDLAINVPPEITEMLLEKANIKCVRTGFTHGTVTAVVQGHGYEITSLRRDISTDGRRATVNYTTDWATDSARRDFTMNAMYVDVEGRLYDYHQGLADLASKRVRFIGDPAQRMAEDYLRLLRYFRFLAWYGSANVAAQDAMTLQACRLAKNHLGALSVERVWSEIKKLLAAPQPVPAVRLMDQLGVLEALWGRAASASRLEDFIELENELNCAPHPLLRLTALAVNDVEAAEKLAENWHLSNAEAGELIEAAGGPTLHWQNEKAVKDALFDHGRRAVRAWFLLTSSRQGWRNPAAWGVVQNWAIPEFPISGRDVMGLGVLSGPAVGKILQDMKLWWQAQGYAPSGAECMAEIRRRLGVRINTAS